MTNNISTLHYCTYNKKRASVVRQRLFAKYNSTNGLLSVEQLSSITQIADFLSRVSHEYPSQYHLQWASMRQKLDIRYIYSN